MLSPPLHSSSHHPVCSLVSAGSFVIDWLALLIVFSIQKTQIGRFCWASLISSSFNVVSHCKTVTLLPFQPLTSFIGHHSSSFLHMKGWKVNISSFYTDVRWSMWAQAEMVWGGFRPEINLRSLVCGVTPACAVLFRIDAWVITCDLISHYRNKCMYVWKKG